MSNRKFGGWDCFACAYCTLRFNSVYCISYYNLYSIIIMSFRKMGNVALIPTFLWILSTQQKNVDFVFINTSFNDVLVIFKYICHVHLSRFAALRLCPIFHFIRKYILVSGDDDDTISSWKIACVIFTEKLGYINDSFMLLQQRGISKKEEVFQKSSLSHGTIVFHFFSKKSVLKRQAELMRCGKVTSHMWWWSSSSLNWIMGYFIYNIECRLNNAE